MKLNIVNLNLTSNFQHLPKNSLKTTVGFLIFFIPGE